MKNHPDPKYYVSGNNLYRLSASYYDGTLKWLYHYDQYYRYWIFVGDISINRTLRDFTDHLTKHSEQISRQDTLAYML